MAEREALDQKVADLLKDSKTPDGKPLDKQLKDLIKDSKTPDGKPLDQKVKDLIKDSKTPDGKPLDQKLADLAKDVAIKDSKPLDKMIVDLLKDGIGPKADAAPDASAVASLKKYTFTGKLDGNGRATVCGLPISNSDPGVAKVWVRQKSGIYWDLGPKDSMTFTNKANCLLVMADKYNGGNTFKLIVIN